MPTSFPQAVELYLDSRNPSDGTRSEYKTTVRKWCEWNCHVSIEELDRSLIRDFLKWVRARAVEDGGTNPGRTTNKARTQLRAVISWAWENDLIDTPPRFPRPVRQRDVAGRHYLTKPELNALYFATHQLPRPRGWSNALSVGCYWRAALVLFFNYGLDTGTVWGTTSHHKPILWKHVCWNHSAPNRVTKQSSRWGWLSYRRVKTGKSFCRPMNRVVHAHLKSLRNELQDSDEPVFLGGSSRPSKRFRELCQLADIPPKTGCRDRRARTVGTQGSEKDLCDVLRRAYARVIHRDPGAFSRRGYVSPLRPSSATCNQGHHDPSPANSFQRVGAWI